MPQPSPALASLIRQIEEEFRFTGAHTGEAALDLRVREALLATPREAFVPEALIESAYDNHPLPIGHGQTISQPYIVALMTQLLHPQPEMTVLEVGTGSGYQAAVLARLVRQVHTTELVPELAQLARERFARLGYGNVTVHGTDGALGLPHLAPFDAIIATAAPRAIPPALIEQLKPGGRLVIPVGGPWSGQQLTLVSRCADGTVTRHPLLPVAFVPMTGAGAEPV